MSSYPRSSGWESRLDETPPRHHVFLWLLEQPAKLSQRALDACSDRSNELS